jgi:chemotaxis signal transduction protein
MENLTLSEQSDIDLFLVPNIAEPTKPIEPVTESEKFVIFQIDDGFFAVPAVSVTEVAQPMAVTALPGSPKWLQGLSNLRGEIVAIVNFEYRKAILRVTQKSKCVVFRPKQMDTPVGFIADRIAEIVSVPENAIRPSEDPNLRGTTEVNSVAIGILDTEKLFASFDRN